MSRALGNDLDSDSYEIPEVYLLFADTSSIKGKKRKTILSDAGFDPSLRRPLERMEPIACTRENLEILRKVFADPRFCIQVLHFQAMHGSDQFKTTKTCFWKRKNSIIVYLIMTKRYKMEGFIYIIPLEK